MGTSNLRSALGQAKAAPAGGIRSPRGKIDIAAEFDKFRGQYQAKAKSKANFLIIGPHGSGKTYGMIHAPAPVVIHSFDPGGTDSIEEEHIESGRILPITECESDDITNPIAFRLWEKQFLAWKDGGFFDEVGTYVIDSFTSFSQALMNEILKARGRKPSAQRADLGKDPDIVPEMQDYLVHQKTLAHYLAVMSSIPCNLVVNAHLNVDKDETTQRMISMVMMDGKKFAQTLPTLFNEVYFADSKPAGPGQHSYFYRLVKKGIEPARSRLRKSGKTLNAEEPQNLKEILKKAGYEWEDKDLFT